MNTSLRAAFFASVLGLAACDDPIRPDDLAGDYQAVAIDGAPPPRVVAWSEECWWSLVEAHLTMHDTGHFLLNYTEHGGCGDNPGIELPGVLEGEFGISGERVIFRVERQHELVIFFGDVSGQRIIVQLPSPTSHHEPAFLIAFERL